MKSPITVLLAEDIEDYRRAIKTALFDPDAEIRVIGEAGNGIELLRLLETLSPDIILLDLNMPQMNGNQTMDILIESYPGIKVIILSGHDQQVLMDDYFLRGAKGYVPKSELSELAAAIIKVNKGGIFRFYKEGNQNAYTPRHKQIITRYAEGKTQKSIADELNLTRFTISKHEKTIMGYLNVKNKAEMIERIKVLGLNFLGKFGLGGRGKSK